MKELGLEDYVAHEGVDAVEEQQLEMRQVSLHGSFDTVYVRHLGGGTQSTQGQDLHGGLILEKNQRPCIRSRSKGVN